ncbi:MAG: hypothetical protein EGR16_08595 [Clostridiales bacterium]|nr:hypothetical protein [Clostridiales bacterium]
MNLFRKLVSAALAAIFVSTAVFVPPVTVSAAGIETKKYTISEGHYYPGSGSDSVIATTGRDLKLNEIQKGGGEWRDKEGCDLNYSRYGFDSSQSNGVIVWKINRDDLANKELNASTKLNSEGDFAYGSRFFSYQPWSSVFKSIADIKDTGELVTYISFSDASYVKDAYVCMMSKNGEIVAVKLTDEFYTESDVGKGKAVSIPLSRFANPDENALIINGELDVNNISGAAVLLHNPDSAAEGWIATGDMFICNVDKATKLTAEMIAEGRANLTWEASLSNVAGYRIYRNGEEIDTVDENTLTYTDTTVKNGEIYKYEVYAYDSYGAMSVASNKASVYASSVGAPQNLKGESSFPDELKVKLTWKDPSYGTPIGYEIYRDDKKIGETDGPALEYIDADSLNEGTYYKYYVKAKASDLSNESNSITVYASKNGYPENISSDTSGENIIVSWNATNSAVKYNIYRNGSLYAAVDAPETSYTDEDWKYSYMYTYTVTSVDANNNESVKSGETNAFKSEKDKVSNEIFTDLVSDDFSVSNFNSSTFELTEEKAIQGKKSIKVKFASGSNLQEGISFAANAAVDMSSMRAEGGRIEFAIFAPNKEAIENVKIGLECTTDPFDGGTYTARTGLNISDYVDLYGYWNYITVPIADFSATGVYSHGLSDNRYCGFKFDKVIGISFYDDVKHFNINKTVYFDDLKFASFSTPVIDSVTLSDGTIVVEQNGTISAAEQQLNVKFNTGIDATTLDGNVKLAGTSENGAVSLPVECEYDAVNKIVKVKFTAGLEKSTSYSLKFDGVKSDKGATITSAAFDFSSNNDDTEGLTTMADEEKVSIPSYTVTKGSSVTLKLSLDSQNAQKAAIDGMNVNVKYTSGVIGNSAVKLATSISDASVTVSDGVINISIPQGTNKYVIGSYIANITFDSLGLGNAAITLDGTVHQATPAKNVKISNAKASNVMVKTKTESSGGSSGGSGGGYGGGRADATIKNPTVVNPTNPDDANIVSDSVFSDSDKFDWATEAIEYLGKNKIINGFGDGTFRPEMSVTREEFVAMIVRAFDKIDENATADFSDADKNEWYYSALATASKLGIINGYDGKFGVGETISRQDMCAMLSRAASSLKIALIGKYATIVFDDESEIAEYAKDCVQKLQSAGIVNGVGGSAFDPNGEVTRAMAAKVIYEMYRIK